VEKHRNRERTLGSAPEADDAVEGVRHDLRSVRGLEGEQHAPAAASRTKIEPRTRHVKLCGPVVDGWNRTVTHSTPASS